MLFFEAIRSKAFFYADDHPYYFLPRWVDRRLNWTRYRLVDITSAGIWLPRGYLPWSPIALSCQVIYVADKVAV